MTTPSRDRNIQDVMNLAKRLTLGSLVAGAIAVLCSAGGCATNTDGLVGNAGAPTAGANGSAGNQSAVAGAGGNTAAGAGAGAGAGGASGGPAAGAGGVSGTAGAAGGSAGGAGGAAVSPVLPCDIYGSDGKPCVGAHSTTRALFGKYGGKLYQVKRASDGETLAVGTLQAGGYADAAAQDTFCSDGTCTISVIYDQTSNGNDLTISKAGGAGGADVGANAAALPAKAGGHRVYGVYVTPGVGYRNLTAKATAHAGEAEGMYMVTSGKHVNDGCCFDYGNTEQPVANDTGNGHMDAVYFGNRCEHPPCSGSGPWIAADLENGLFQGNGSNMNDASTAFDLVTAMLKNDGKTKFALKTGNAQTGGLTTQYAGTLPTAPGYIPMSQEGGIVLGVGGDNSNRSAGDFYEGVMTAGYPSDSAEAAVQTNIVSVGYAAATYSPVISTSEQAPQSWKYTTAVPDPSWNTSAFNDASWSSGNGGFGTAGTPGAIIGTVWSTGDIWLRRTFPGSPLTAAQIGNLVLRLHHDEAAEVFVNGVEAASVTGYTTSYQYSSMAKAAQSAISLTGGNVLAVHCHNTEGGQYIDVGISSLAL